MLSLRGLESLGANNDLRTVADLHGCFQAVALRRMDFASNRIVNDAERMKMRGNNEVKLNLQTALESLLDALDADWTDWGQKERKRHFDELKKFGREALESAKQDEK